MCSKPIRLRMLVTASFMLTLPIMMQIATAAVPKDACALLPQSQVAAVLGVEVDAGRDTIGTGQVCRWRQAGKSPGADVALLQVALMKAEAFEIGKTPVPNWNKPSVSGIGDDAYFTDNGKVTFPISPALAVKKGPVIFTITALIPKTSIEQIKALEKSAALKILERL